VQTVHSSLEIRYLQGMDRSKAAIREVLRFRNQFEDMLTLSEGFNRFKNRFTAWNPLQSGDPDLSAKRSLLSEAATDETYENGVFKYICDTILSMSSGQVVEETTLWYGIRCDPDDEDAKTELLSTWKGLTARNMLGGQSQRNFAAAFTVGCKSEHAWNQWKKWLREDYKAQLKYIMSTRKAQDSGNHSHVTESFVIGDQAIPKGFSVSHIRTKNPQDESDFEIELGTELKNEDKLFKEIEVMEKMLKTPTDDEDGVKKVKLNERLDDASRYGKHYEIGIRFVLSEQYYMNMPKEVAHALLEGTGDDPPKCFTDFVGRMLTPCCEAAKDTIVPDADDDFCDMTLSYLTVIMGEPDPLKSLFSSGTALARRMLVIIVCGLFVFIVPFFRFAVQKGELFPKPFAECLLLNAFCCGAVLCAFLNEFSSTSDRLRLVSACLAGFQQKTLDPSGKAKMEKKTKVRQSKTDTGEKVSAKKGDNESGDPLGSAFDLTVNEPKGVKYDPQDEYWISQWDEKLQNVQNWHFSAGYMRVFVSSSRLTAQSILIAAGAILGFLAIFSFVQVLQGRNGAQVSSMTANFAAGLAEKGKEAVGKSIADARRLSLSLAKSGISGAVLSGESNTSILELSAAKDALHKQVHAFRNAVISSEPRQLSSNVKDTMQKMQKMVDIAHTITKTQVLTVAMVLLILVYSIPLLYYIATINDEFDKHGSMLLGQREVHRINMARREASKSEARGEDEGEGAQSQEPGERGEDGGEDASGKGKGGQDTGGKDRRCKRYEKMLDLAIQIASKNKTRFPLKLFGFVINMTLLTTWVALAGTPLIKQVSAMVPGIAMASCQWVEHSSLMQHADAVVHRATRKANVGSSLKVSKIFEDVVCKNFKKMVAKKTRKAAHLAQSRRLSAAPPLAHVVEKWWKSHPGSWSGKLIGTLEVLDELERDAELHQALDDKDESWYEESLLPEVLEGPSSSFVPTGITPQSSDLLSWGQLHHVPDSIMSAIEAEEIGTVAELAVLSDSEIAFLSQKSTLGGRARFMLLVKTAREAHSYSSIEL